MRDLNELKQLQSLPLAVKIQKTQKRLEEWIDTFGVDGVYISFSGGKDSTVLLHIARQMYPKIKAVFSDTGLEYPEIREFVKTFDNVDWLKPKMTFKQVIKHYGYPFISKEVSGKIDEARKKPGGYAYRALHGSKQGTAFDISKWAYLIDAPFKMHSYCCNAMKKNPAKAYEKLTHRVPITAQMACESKVRKTQWLKYGCNAFTKKRKISNPMSFWTEQDVLLYIYMQKLPIASVYGDVVIDYEGMGQVKNQMNLADYGIFDLEIPLLKTTGCDRTGCFACGYGCHLEKRPNRFELIDMVSNPNMRDFCMRGGEFKEDGLWKPSKEGLGYWFVMKWINVHGGFDMYIPDYEKYESKYGNERTRELLRK